MSPIQESFDEVKKAFDPMMERAQLIQVATVIHAACIALEGTANVEDSVHEAFSLIAECDAVLEGTSDEEPSEP